MYICPVKPCPKNWHLRCLITILILNNLSGSCLLMIDWMNLHWMFMNRGVVTCTIIPSADLSLLFEQGNHRWQTSPAAPPGGLVRRECACQISWWSVEKWRRYYILKFHGNTFRWPTTLTFDLKFWKYLSVTEYPYSMCMLSFMMIGWEMTEILHFEILRKHGQTHKQTDMGITIPRPPPMGGEVTSLISLFCATYYITLACVQWPTIHVYFKRQELLTMISP